MDVLIDGAACVRSKSANAATVDGAVPLRIVLTHTVSSKGRRQASDGFKKRMIIRSIEVGLECNHPNWICCGDYNASESLVGEACAHAREKFGLAQAPTATGDPKRGKDFFISPFGFKTASVKDTIGFGDNAHNALSVKVPTMLPCRSYLRPVVPQPDILTPMGIDPKSKVQQGSRKSNLSDSGELPAAKSASASSGPQSMPAPPSRAPPKPFPPSPAAPLPAPAPMAAQLRPESVAGSVAGSVPGEDSAPGEDAMATTTAMSASPMEGRARTRPDLQSRVSYPPSVQSLATVSGAEPLALNMIRAFGSDPNLVSDSAMAAAASFVATNPSSVVGGFLSDAAADAETSAAPTKLNRSSEMDVEGSPAPVLWGERGAEGVERGGILC